MGRHGTKVALRFQASDDSGVARVRLGIYAGPLPVAMLSFRPRGVKAIYSLAWRAPKAGVGYRFCVQASDERGNESRQSCAPIHLTGKRR